MNPNQRNKVDLSQLTEAQQRLFRRYGKLPPLLDRKFKGDRKYFDSGDYALSKAGKTSDDILIIGTKHPQAENIHHPSSPPNPASMLLTGGGGSIGAGIGGGADGGSHFLPGTGGHRGSIHGIHGIQGGSMMGMPAGQRKSPVKESSYLARSASVDEGYEQEKEAAAEEVEEAEAAEAEEKFNFGDAGQEGEEEEQLHQTSVNPSPMKEGLPIRR